MVDLRRWRQPMRGLDAPDRAAPDLPAPVLSVAVEAAACVCPFWPHLAGWARLRWLWRAVCDCGDGGRRCGSARVWWLVRGGHCIRGGGEGLGGHQRGGVGFRWLLLQRPCELLQQRQTEQRRRPHPPVLRIRHWTHHQNHGHMEKDESWHPLPQKLYRSLDSATWKLRFALPLPMLVYPFYLWSRSPGKSGSHLHPCSDLFQPNEKTDVLACHG